MSANKPIDWEVSFEPSKLDRLAPGDKAMLQLSSKLPRQALPGDYVTKITARAPEADTTTDFRISVKTPMITGWIGVVVILAAFKVPFTICFANTEGGRLCVKALSNWFS